MVRRMTAAIRPPNIRKITAKQLFDSIATSREEGACSPSEAAVRAFQQTKMTATADEYCNEFLRNLISVNNAAESMFTVNPRNSDTLNPYTVQPGLASIFFVLGIDDEPWLDTLRQIRTTTADSCYVPLNAMIATIRLVKKRPAATGRVMVAADRRPKTRDRNMVGYDEERCQLYKHRHLNKNCHKQHPELAPKRRGISEGNRNWKEAARISIAEEISEGDSGRDDQVVYLGRSSRALAASNV